VAYGVGISSVEEIDDIGIAQATRKAMAAAIAQLQPKPQALLVDAVDLSYLGVPSKAIIDGDALCKSIAAASIIAKVSRDRLMLEMDAAHPGYGFARHKGYGTAEHLRRLRALGPCAIHRRSFAPIRELLLQPRLGV
jgi:ribonuclease HII